MVEMFGPYQVRERIGVGGMAIVHRAELEIGGIVSEIALKRLHPELADDPSFVRRFVAEARLGQRLRHANIAHTYDIGCIGGVHFIAFEYVHGPTVLELLRRTIKTGPLPVRLALHIVTHVARALAFAHGVRTDDGRPLRLIHRDIAPSNIIVSDTGTTKLIDFGFAKTAGAHVHTGVGRIIGKLGYVAPEYLRGVLDPRVDVYSLGVVAHELLTARQLFGVTDLRTAEQMRRSPIDPPSKWNPEVPSELDDIVLTALQYDPAQRWQTAYALYGALANLQRSPAFAITDRDVATWVAALRAPAPAPEPAPAPAPVAAPVLPPSPTAEIAVGVDLDVEAAFSHMVPSAEFARELRPRMACVTPGR